MKGKLIIADGIDGCGKGTIINTIADWCSKHECSIFDLKRYWQEKKSFPEAEDLKNFNVIISAEPTFAYVGQGIREELTQKNKRDYSAESIAQAFALDREILYKRIHIPLLKEGKIILQERSVVSSMVYQPAQKDGYPREDILKLPGNKLTLEQYPPDLLIIPILNPKTAMERLGKRIEKQDDSIFEKLNFLKKIDKVYRGEELKKMMENYGSQVIYINTDGTLEETKEQTIKLWEQFINK